MKLSDILAQSDAEVAAEGFAAGYGAGWADGAWAMCQFLMGWGEEMENPLSAERIQ